MKAVKPCSEFGDDGRAAFSNGWSPQSWRHKPISHQPVWPDLAELKQVTGVLSQLAPLILAGEARQLQDKLAAACRGEAFVLQVGDCAESFAENNADSICDQLNLVLQMAIVLSYASGVPVINIGRIAGQFGKPRSSPVETVGDIKRPSFMGHIVNDLEFSAKARRPNPQRLLRAYRQSVSTLNLLRAFRSGGYVDLHQAQQRNQAFVASSPQRQRYQKLVDEVEQTLPAADKIGVHFNQRTLKSTDFYTSHEALILEYEEALTRQDSPTQSWYGSSAHMLWVGDRTRNLDGAHVEFMRGLNNPLACKLGPTAQPDEVVRLCEMLNPQRRPGRLTLISRLGAAEVMKALPPLIKAVQKAGHPVLWQCDPMHGNTYTVQGYKTRDFETIMSELVGYFKVHAALKSWPGGIHLEMTAQKVTECLGGSQPLRGENLKENYETLCDPRLNADQSLDLVFHLASQLMKVGRSVN